MLVANAPLAEGAEGFVNGDTGHVLAYSPEEEKAEIELDDGRRVMVGRFMWTQEEYRVSWRDVRPRLERYTVGWFSQLPLRLAYAMTIHKAQGLTFDRAHIELGRERGTFAGGQLYTALSRCRSLAGLTLNRALRAGDVLVDPDVVAFYENLPALSTPVPATECHT
jgi:ATP-dependent exoDNAse (exonuclease V) alpha subunit